MSWAGPQSSSFFPCCWAVLPVCWALKWAAGSGSAPCGGFYSVCALLCGVGTLLVGLAPAWGGLFGMMLVQGALEVYLLHERQKLNDAIPSDQRATLISVDSMAYSLLMIPASPLVGAVGDAFGRPVQALPCWAGSSC